MVQPIGPRLEFRTAGGGSSTFLALTDTPASYAGAGSQFVRVNAGATALEFATPAGGGDVSGPTVSTDNAVARFSGTTGGLIQNSGVIIDDSNNVTGVVALTTTGVVTATVAGLGLDVQNTTDAASNQVAQFSGGNRGTAIADNDEGYITFRLDDDTGTQVEMVRFTWKALDISATTLDSRPELQYYTANTLRELVFPAITADDVVVTEAFTQTLTNKTIGVSDFTNTIEADTTHIQVRNESGGAMAKGDAVHISGYSIGQDLPLVIFADADSGTTMPALGIANEAIANNANGEIVVSGRISGIDTSTFSIGDPVYISGTGTTGNTLSTKPTGDSQEIQKVGIVLRSHASLGVMEVIGAGRSNDIPNSATPTGAWDFGGATSVEVPNGAGGTTVNAAGEVTIDTTPAYGHFNFHDGTAEMSVAPLQQKNIVIENPTSTDEFTMWFTDEAITVRQVNDVLTGSTSITWDILHATARNATAPNALIGATDRTTSSASGAETTTFSDATIPAGSWIWYSASGASGTPTSLAITVSYTVDP